MLRADFAHIEGENLWAPSGVALCVALVAAAVLPVPAALPSVAIRQPSLYRMEIAFCVFYGFLLLLTPAFSGLVRGRLPIEVSMRGARFVAEADQSTEANKKTIENLKTLVDDVTERQRLATIEIDRLKNMVERDNTQPPIDSNK